MTNKWCGIGANILFLDMWFGLIDLSCKKAICCTFLVYAMEYCTFITERARCAIETLCDSCGKRLCTSYAFISIVGAQHWDSRSWWWIHHSHLVAPLRANMSTAMLQTLKAKPKHCCTPCQWSLSRLSNSLVKHYLDHLDAQKLLRTTHLRPIPGGPVTTPSGFSGGSIRKYL